jgi:AbrB family looped-hinge helix DNA binding protein
MITKKVDQLGRIGIPKAIRRELGMEPDTPVEFILNRSMGELILKIKQNRCMKCSGEKELIEVTERVFLCRRCLGLLLQE